MNTIALTDPQLAMLIQTVRTAEIHASAAREVVALEEAIQKAVTKTREALGDQEPTNDLRYDLELSDQTAGITLRMLQNATTQGANARLLLGLTAAVAQVVPQTTE